METPIRCPERKSVIAYRWRKVSEANTQADFVLVAGLKLGLLAIMLTCVAVYKEWKLVLFTRWIFRSKEFLCYKRSIAASLVFPPYYSGGKERKYWEVVYIISSIIAPRCRLSSDARRSIARDILFRTSLTVVQTPEYLSKDILNGINFRSKRSLLITYIDVTNFHSHQ